jgi:hypothetical protein
VIDFRNTMPEVSRQWGNTASPVDHAVGVIVVPAQGAGLKCLDYGFRRNYASPEAVANYIPVFMPQST